MRNGRIATWKLSEWITELATTPMWLGLCSLDPYSVDDPLTAEIGGAVYRRPQARWESASPTLLRNAEPLRWAGLVPGTRVVTLAAWTAAYNGKLVVTMPLAEPRDFPAGGALTLSAGEVYIGLDV